MNPIRVTTAGTNKVLYFDGTSFFSRKMQRNFPSTAFTIALWFQSVAGGESGTILSFATLDNPDALVISDPSSLKIRIQFSTFAASLSLVDGQWHHIAITVGGNNRNGAFLPVYDFICFDFSNHFIACSIGHVCVHGRI
jgi:hypothetical protein